MSVEIGVRVVRGSSEPWLLVPAQPLSGVMELYCILDHDVPPGVELAFGPGQIVTVLDTPDAEGNFWPVAKLYTGAIL